MRRTSILATTILAAVSAVGCGTQNGTGGATSADGPSRAVFQFLEAVRLGDDKQAGAMLTELAQKKTAELDMVVAPPGSDTASFEVGQAEMAANGSAHVTSVWTDLDHEGQPRKDEITWILKQESHGWRIAGMSTRLFDDMDPLVMNFEDPEDMLRQQRMAEQETLRRANHQNLEARKGTDDPFQKGPR